MFATLAHTTYHPSILCWAGSHARTSLSPVRVRAWRVKDPAYSLKSCAFVARWHPGSSVLRTWQRSITEDWMPFSGSLPRAAIVYDMAIFEHPMWAHRTAESGGSRSPGESAWPTPTVSEAERGHGYQRSGDRLYPTLTGAVGATKHWPTPDAGVFNYSEAPASWDARRARIKRELGNGNGAGRLLAVEVRREWPTPAASDHKGSSKIGQRRGQLTEKTEPGRPGRLNPCFVEALMGFPDNWTAINGPPHLDHSMPGSRPGPDPDSDTTGND